MTFQLDKLQKISNIVKQSAKANFRHNSDLHLILDGRGMEDSDINHLVGAGIRYLSVGSNFTLARRKEIVNPVKYRLLENIDLSEIGRVFDDYELIENIETIEQVQAIAFYGLKIGKSVSGLVKVDLIGKTGRFGVFPENLADFLKSAAAYSGVKIKGFCVDFPPFNSVQDAELVYRKLFNLIEFLKLKFKRLKLISVNLNLLSDVELAVRFGATELRLGKKILEND